MRTYASWIIRFRALVIAAVVLVTLLFAVAASHIRIDISRKDQMPAGNPLVRIDNRIVKKFGGAREVVLAVVAQHGTIYTPAILEKLKKITASIEAMPGVVHRNVLSIAAQKVRSISGSTGELDVRSLMQTVPTTAQGLVNLRDRIAEEPFYTPLIVSRDGRAAAVLADFRHSSQGSLSSDAIASKLQAIAAQESDANATVYVAGMPVWLSDLDRYAHQMPIYLFIAIVIIAAIHYEAFRTVQAMLLPLVTALISVVWAMGWLGISGLPMDTWNSMTPILVLAVAAGHAVQILKRYYEEYQRTGDNHTAVAEALTKIGPAMLMAGVTASLGFASLAVFDIRTLRVFGLISAAGILSALIIEMTLIPAIRSMLPAPARISTSSSKWRVLDMLVRWIGNKAITWPGCVLGGGAVITAVAIFGMSRIAVNNSFDDAMPAKHPYRVAESAVNRYFGGINTMNILIDTHKPNGIKDPSVMKAISGLQAFLAQQPHVGATQSIADYVKQLNRAMHDNNPTYFRIPKRQPTIAQYLFLYSMSGGPDDFDMVVTNDYRSALIRVFSKDDENAYIGKLFSNTRIMAAKLLPPGVRVSIAGGTLGIAYALNETVVHDKILNILQLLLIIFICSSVVFRSIVAGLYVLVPSTLAMLVNLGVMGLTGIPLNLATAATSALTVSIGADYAIYLIYRLREGALQGEDLNACIRRAVRSTGHAIFYVSSAIASGYLVLLFTKLLYYRELGGLVASSMVVSSLGAITLIPAMVARWRPRFIIEPSFTGSETRKPAYSKL